MDNFIQIFKKTKWDNDKVNILESFPKEFFTNNNIITIIKEFSYDSGRNESLPIICRNVNSLSTQTLKSILNCYRYDSDKNNGISIMLHKINNIDIDGLCSILKLYQYDSDRNNGIQIMLNRINQLNLNNLYDILILYKYDSDKNNAIDLLLNKILCEYDIEKLSKLLSIFCYDSERLIAFNKLINNITDPNINNLSNLLILFKDNEEKYYVLQYFIKNLSEIDYYKLFNLFSFFDSPEFKFKTYQKLKHLLVLEKEHLFTLIKNMGLCNLKLLKDFNQLNLNNNEILNLLKYVTEDEEKIDICKNYSKPEDCNFVLNNLNNIFDSFEDSENIKNYLKCIGLDNSQINNLNIPVKQKKDQLSKAITDTNQYSSGITVNNKIIYFLGKRIDTNLLSDGYYELTINSQNLSITKNGRGLRVVSGNSSTYCSY